MSCCYKKGPARSPCNLYALNTDPCYQKLKGSILRQVYGQVGGVPQADYCGTFSSSNNASCEDECDSQQDYLDCPCPPKPCCRPSMAPLEPECPISLIPCYSNDRACQDFCCPDPAIKWDKCNEVPVRVPCVYKKRALVINPPMCPPKCCPPKPCSDPGCSGQCAFDPCCGPVCPPAPFIRPIRNNCCPPYPKVPYNDTDSAMICCYPPDPPYTIIQPMEMKYPPSPCCPPLSLCHVPPEPKCAPKPLLLTLKKPSYQFSMSPGGGGDDERCQVSDCGDLDCCL